MDTSSARIPVEADSSSRESSTFRSHSYSPPLSVALLGNQLRVCDSRGSERSLWQLDSLAGEPLLTRQEVGSWEPAAEDIVAAIETVFSLSPDFAVIRVRCALPEPMRRFYTSKGASEEPIHVVHRAAFFQQPDPWLCAPGNPYPLQYKVTGPFRHPVRPEKPQGVVYQRHIPWLKRTLSFRTVDAPRDLATFNRWMNDRVVAHFWQEEGDLDRHRAYINTIEADPHVVGLIGSFDEDPFGYFEVYWAKEDRIAPFCDASDHDRGWHVLIGEARYRGRAFLTAWMPSIAHYLFLDDCRTQRLVIEPRIDNHKMIRNLGWNGYALMKEFDFPHKRAMLGVLLRERFFAGGLWWPLRAYSEVPPQPAPLASTG